MSEITLPEYQSIAAELQSASLAVTPAELHGLLRVYSRWQIACLIL